MASVLVVGSIAYDSVETSVGKRDEMLGGSATFFSTAASIFAPVQVVAVVGEDFRHSDLDFLRSRNVDFSGLQTESGKTFRWGGRYSADFSSRETLFTHLNVFKSFNPVIPSKFRRAAFVFLANIGPELQMNVLEQVEAPRFVALDTMNFWIDRSLPVLRDVLSRVNGIIINDEEAQMLTGQTNLIRAIRYIRDMGPQVVIVKKGEHGAILSSNQDIFFLPAYPVENLVDPTGAGDTFAGGFMGYLAARNSIDSKTLRNATVVGSALASFCVEGFGTENIQRITREKVLERHQRFHELTAFDEQLEI